jgi:hypothetical protein
MTTDDDVLRELETALNVSPSPGFEARVRERVRQRSFAVPRWRWTVGLAAAATVVLAVMLVPGRDTLKPGDRVVANAGTSQPAIPDAAEPSHPPPARAVRRAESPSRMEAAPSLVVPSGQMAAIERLMAAVAAGRVVMAAERSASTAALQINAVAAAPSIEFDPIRLTPLSPEASPDLWR